MPAPSTGLTLGTGLTDPWANGATAIIYTGEKRSCGAGRASSAKPDWRHPVCGRAGRLPAGLENTPPPRAGRLSTLRHGLMAGETPPPGLFEDWARTGRPLYEALGMSEISTYVSSGPNVRPGASSARRSRTSCCPSMAAPSRCLPARKACSPHHARSRADAWLLAAARRGEPEHRGDWFVGGDAALIDAEGYVFHRGRANDLMKALGYRMSKVEAALAEFSVAEVACAEVKVRADVSVITAFVVPHAGFPADAADIERFAARPSPVTSGHAPSCLSRRYRAPPTARSCARR